MGVVNVTPDSFSDGGAFRDAEAAVAHGRALAAEGAAILDVGGESTRPGAAPVPEDEERRRVVPVVEGLRAAGAGEVSVDTSKAAVAAAALAAGATIVNDVTALRGDPAMAEVVAGSGARLCLMHMRGEPRTMQGAHVAMERANANPVPADAPASAHADVILELSAAAQALAGSP